MLVSGQTFYVEEDAMDRVEQLKKIEEVIQEEAHELAEEIRQYCRNQRESWRLVPYLALQADGRQHLGIDKPYPLAYKFGYWPLDNNWDMLHVDLESGELVLYEEYGKDDCPGSASDAGVLSLVGCMSSIDTAVILADLREAAGVPYDEDMKTDGINFYADTPAGTEAWRVRKREELKLDEMYSRKEGIPRHSVSDTNPDDDVV